MKIRTALRLYFCPSCARVYFLPKDTPYLCGRNHVASVWPDGRVRRFVISNRSETDKPPWPVPTVAEEREILNEEFTEAWVDECPHPEDTDYGDVTRHFGFGAPGGRHLTREQVLEKYSPYVLRPVESQTPEVQSPSAG